jgi:glycosyltransferase involved in cell wall biosynthesis
MPKVSVVIPTFNRASLVWQAVDSVLQQSMSDLEVIVVDDGSTDDTQNVLGRYADDPRVRLVAQANAGRSLARNLGASLAGGEWVGFLDSDDRYLPNCLADHLKASEEKPASDLTLGGYDYVSDTGSVLGERRPWLETADLSVSSWLFNCLAMPGSILVRRSWFERVGGFDRQCEIAEDWDLFLRLALNACPMQWVRSKVCQYRLHSGNSVRTLALHQQGSWLALKKVFALPSLDPSLQQKQPEVFSHLQLLFAQRALALGEFALARDYVRAAVDPISALSARRRIEMAEFVLSRDYSESTRTHPPEVLALVRDELALSTGELRKAQARSLMKQFFFYRQTGRHQQATRFLHAALKLDLSWLSNRGVVSHLLRLTPKPVQSDRHD